MQKNERPIVAITLGDPASVGPEITLKALNHKEIYDKCKPLVVGDALALGRAKEILNLKDLQINSISCADEGLFVHGVIDVLRMNLLEGVDYELGRVSKIAGDASYQYVVKAIQMAMDKEVDATVTNAINKEAINLAGHKFNGHTEIYAQQTNTSKYTMMLCHENLRVVHVSTHVSLREACDLVKQKRVLEVIELANKACIDIGIKNPKIGVAGLNPHSGENGLFGREEIEEITPAIEDAKAKGLNVEGPVPPDTVFSKARGGWYDIVVAMYHDQGHIPLKVVGFVYDTKEQKWTSVAGVNITLGLPIIRTSVDHGTAFDQAGKGSANELSLLNAIEYAINFAQQK